MQKINIGLFIFFVFGISIQSYAQIITFDMDKPSSNNLKNSSKATYEGILIGNLSFVADRFGNECRALAFDGNGYLSVSNSENLHLQNFSVSVWLKLPATNFQWLTIICKGETVAEHDNSPAYRVQLTSSTASFNTNSTLMIGNITQNYPKDVWFHLCTVKEQNLFSVFVNGNLSYQFSATTPITDNTELLNIGRDVVGRTEFFTGIMDDFKLYDYAINSNEVSKIFAIKPLKSGSACVLSQRPAEIDVDITSTKPIITQPKPTNIDIDITDIKPQITQKLQSKPTNIDIDLGSIVPETDKITTNEDIDVGGITPQKADSVVVFNGAEVKVGELIKLENLQFAQSSAILLVESNVILDKVVKLMNENPMIAIELQGHTDNVGNANKNFLLSLDRVRSTKEYLVAKGIATNRISVKGFGGRKPIASNDSEQTRKLNRRVEMKIIIK